MRYLRLYECLQMTIPGFIGFVSHYPLSYLFKMQSIFYFLAYFFHLLFVYSYNDFYDFDKDQYNPRKRKLKSKNRNILKLVTLCSLIGSILALLVLPLRLLFLFIVLNGLGIIYSRFKRPALVGFPFGQLAHFISGTCYFLTGILLFKTEIFLFDYIGAYCFGLLYLSGGQLSEVIDYWYDKEYGLKTLTISLGQKNSLYVFIFAQALTLIGFNVFLPSRLLFFVCLLGGIWYFQAIRYSLSTLFTQETFINLRSYSRIYFGIITGIIIILLCSN